MSSKQASIQYFFSKVRLSIYKRVLICFYQAPIVEDTHSMVIASEMAIDPEPLDLARDRLEVHRTEQGTWLEISGIEPK